MRLSTFGLLVIGALVSGKGFAATGNATVVVLRGTAKLENGKALAVKDIVKPGATVATGPRSFVRLLFPDNTQMNLGPDTTMKLEPTKPGEASIVDLVGGQLRAKVTKDLLKKDEGGEPKEKMVVKTRTAAMGIRGTDFNVSFNRMNLITALVTFEGMVAMAKLDGNAARNPLAVLHNSAMVQSVAAGQFSGAQPDQAKASIPVKISPAQLETLKGNESFQGLGGKGGARASALGSPVPPGVDPKAFASGAEKQVQAAVAKVAGNDVVRAVVSETRQLSSAGPDQKAPPPEGFHDKKTGDYAPRAGGFLDLASGRYIPPPPGSSFDANTGVFVPPRAMGQFDPVTGNYVPPKGVELDPVKGFVAAAPAPGTTTPASAPGAAPPPDAVQALVVAMNTATSPDAAGTTVTFDATFAPTAGSGTFMPPPPPPPPTTTEPLPPPPDKPVDNTYCPTCLQDNVAPAAPTTTGVNLHFTVQ